MPPKGKFRESKTGDEENEFLEKSVPKTTRYVTKWSFNIFAQWQNARPNKEAVNEKVGFHVERDKIQSLDTNIREVKTRVYGKRQTPPTSYLYIKITSDVYIKIVFI